MNNFRLACALRLLLSLSVCSVIQAQVTRTWVSGVGHDLNACSRTAPCRNFCRRDRKDEHGGVIT